MANSPAYNAAMSMQGRTVRELIQAGYTRVHAEWKARLWYPTPAQARMQKARAAKKAGNNV